MLHDCLTYILPPISLVMHTRGEKFTTATSTLPFFGANIISTFLVTKHAPMGVGCTQSDVNFVAGIHS